MLEALITGNPVAAVAGGLALAAAVVFFRRFPVATLCLLVAVAAVPALVLAPTVTNTTWWWPFLACAVFGYRVGERRDEVRPVLSGLAAVVLAALPVGVLADSAARGGFGLVFGLYDWFVLVLVLLLVVALPWLAGRYRAQRAALASAGWERAALLERQKQLEADQARLRERSRIAREMHDSLGHEWGLLALRAAALEVSTDLPERQREMAGELRAGVAGATARLREVIGMLRPDGETDDGADIDGLIARAVAAGMRIEWDPPRPSPRPAAVERAAHRVVREGLTNAAKHAPGAAVTVRLEHGPDSTTVTVVNGPATGQPGGSADGGSGLMGLTERVRLLGGSLRAGPRDGGFALVATLPHDAQPAPVAVGTESVRARSRAEARRGLAAAMRVPALAAAVVVVLAIALYALVGANNSLDPATFAGIPVGAARADVEDRLPPFQILGDPERMLPAPPEGTECRQYWSTRQSEDRLFFRLCFVADWLASKETVPRSAISSRSE
ncbi:histidine kinase [Amycolatopsis endophytica]